jgi:hypothetical protein
MNNVVDRCQQDSACASRQLPGANEFRHAPRLRDTTPWPKRWVAIKDFADSADAMIQQMLS